MKGYTKDYFETIKKGLDTLIATDEQGNVLDCDEAMER